MCAALFRIKAVKIAGVLLTTWLLLVACRASPFDSPRYPRAAEYITSVDGYQRDVADEKFSIYSGATSDRYVQHLAVSGQYLFAARCGLTIFDISLPEQIRAIGSYQDECVVDDLVITNSLAYLATTDKKILVLDVSDPTQPERLATYEYENDPNALASGLVIKDEFLYFYTPLEIPPSSNSFYAPRSQYRGAGWYLEVPLWQIVHMRKGESGIQFERVGRVEEVGRPTLLNGRYIYATSAWHQPEIPQTVSRLQILEIQNNGKVIIVFDRILPVRISDMKIYDDTLFISLGMGVQTWDVSDPRKPVEIDTRYNAVGNIGVFATIDVDNTKLLGQGHSLLYDRDENTVRFRLLATIPTPKFTESDDYLGLVGSAQGPIIYRDYAFRPYARATKTSELSEETIHLGIRVYRFP